MATDLPDGFKMADVPDDDPFFLQFKFCKTCKKHVGVLLAYTRELENVQVVAKQALEIVSRETEKTSNENRELRELIKELQEKNTDRLRADINTKMSAINRRYESDWSVSQIIEGG